jgi:hypothetical protein
MPRDSLMAQTTCWASILAIVDAPVLGRPLFLRPVLGRDIVVLYSGYEYDGYDVDAEVKEVDGRLWKTMLISTCLLG